MVTCAPSSSQPIMSSHVMIDYITDEIVSHPDSGGDVYVSPDSRYIVIVDSEGNTLTVTSVTDDGKGTTFTFHLPHVFHRLCEVLGVTFHFSLSILHSSLIFMSLLTVSFHLNLGLPLGHFPSIFILATTPMLSVSCLLFPNHSSLLLLITIALQ